MGEQEAVRVILDREDWPEGTTSDDVAKAIVKAVDKVRATMWRPIGPPIKEGMMFKSFLTAKTHYVLWIGEESPGSPLYAWIVTEDSAYGWFGLVSSPFWRHTTPLEPKKGVTRNVKQFDGEGEPILDDSGKQVTVKVEYPPVHEKVLRNDSWAVGDKMSVRQGNHYEVIAIHQNGVLMRESETGHVWPECNADLKKYYRKEEADW